MNEDDRRHAQHANHMLDEALTESTGRRSSELTSKKQDPLLLFDPQTQCYFLNQQAREQGYVVTGKILSRLGRHAPTLATLSPNDRTRTLDIILGQSQSLEQGKGPSAILKEQNPKLHKEWLYAQRNPRPQRSIVEAGRTRAECAHNVSSVTKTERFMKHTTFATIALASVIAGSLHFTKNEPIEQYTPIEEVSAVVEAPQQDLESLLKKYEYTPLSENIETNIDANVEPEVATTTLNDVSQDYEFELPVSKTWDGWSQDYEGLALTKDVTFEQGQQLYKTFLDAGVPKDVAIASVEATAINNDWYAAERIIDGELQGNPLLLDSFPRAGETYTLTLDATELAPQSAAVEPAFEPYTVSYTPQNGIGVLEALKEVVDGEIYKQASGVSLIATGLENDLFPERCLTPEGGFDGSACRPALDIEPWFAGQEYDLVVTLPEEFSKANNYGGNYTYTHN